MFERTVAHWECPRCHRLASLTFPTCYSIDRWCTCYAIYPARGGFGELRTIVRMVALNDLAKAYDAYEIQEADRQKDLFLAREDFGYRGYQRVA